MRLDVVLPGWCFVTAVSVLDMGLPFTGWSSFLRDNDCINHRNNYRLLKQVTRCHIVAGMEQRVLHQAQENVSTHVLR
jgi:hypothetical protein